MASDWNSRADRRAAKKKFWDELLRNKDLADKCINDSDEARRTFAQLGDFYLEEAMPANADPSKAPIGKDVEFRVFPKDVAARDKLVVLVLRTPGEQFEPPDPDGVWACTYDPYV